eukprot:1368188-Amorphochlora_amoeboformis.AAC.1
MSRDAFTHPPASLGSQVPTDTNWKKPGILDLSISSSKITQILKLGKSIGTMKTLVEDSSGRYT